MELEKLLSECFLFKKMDAQGLQKVAQIAEEVKLPAYDTIFNANSAGDCMYFIRYGSVVVEKDGEEIARLGAGSHFGEVALLDHQERSATVQTAERTELIKLDRERFEQVLADDPKLAADVFHTFCVYLCGRLRRTSEQMAFFKELASHHHG